MSCNTQYIEDVYPNTESPEFKALNKMHYELKRILKLSEGVYEKNDDIFAHKQEAQFALAVQAVGRLNRSIKDKYNTTENLVAISSITRKISINVLPYREQIFRKYGVSKQGVLFEDDYLPSKKTSTSKKKGGNEKYQKLTDKATKALYDSYKQRSQLEKELLSTKDFDSKKEIATKLNTLNTKIDNLKDKLEATKNFKTIEDVKGYFTQDLEDIKAILAKDTVSPNELEYLQHTINFWNKLLNFKNLKEVDEIGIFSRQDLESDKIMNGYTDLVTGERVEGFNNLKNNLEIQEGKLTELQQNEVLNEVRKHSTKDWTFEDLFKKIADIGAMTGNLLDISRYNIPLVGTLFNLIKKANFRGYLDTKEQLENIDELAKKAESKLKKYERNGNLYDLFFQKNADGELSNRMVWRFKQAFFDAQNEQFFKVKKETKSKTKTKESVASAWKEFNKWKSENEIVFDVRKLFPTQEGESYQYDAGLQGTSEEIEKHKEQLKSILGDEDFEKYMLWVEDKVNQFKFDYEIKKAEIESNSVLDDADKKEALEIWDRENSPYYHSKIVSDGDIIKYKKQDNTTIFIQNKGYKYTKSVPKLEKWFDSNYKIIQADEDIDALYNKFVDILQDIHSILPEHELDKISINTIPLLKKDLVEKLSSKGMGIGLTQSAYNFMVDAITASESSEISTTTRDLQTGKPYRELRQNIFTDNYEEIKKVVTIKKLEYKNANKKEPTYEMIKKWRESAIDSFIKREQSTDLLKTMKVAALRASTYKQKALVEDNVKLLETVINKLQEAEVNGEGTVLRDGSLNTIGNDKNLANLKSSVEHFTDAFYGNPLRNKELIGKKKILTTVEKEQEKRLTELEDSDVLADKDLQEIEKLKKSLGRNVNRASYIDGVIKWTYYKILGWNIPSAIANIGIGQISNYIEASAGLLYNTTQLNKAYGYIKSNRLNIEKLAKHFDVLKESANELIEDRRIESTSRLRLLSPFEMQRRGEWLNQIPVFVAILQNESYGDSNLYEMFKDGDLSQVDIDTIERVKIKVDQALKKIHGNYDPESLVKAKKSVYGRALIQFRSFMSEAYANRFEGEKYDMALDMQRKGRYRSYATFGNVEGMLFLTKQLGRKLLFQSTQFDTLIGEEFTELDAANMRANMSELMVVIASTLFILALSHLGGSDDDKKKRRNFAINALINQGLRMQNDMLMFTNPMTVESMSKNILPLTATLTDMNKWRKDSWKFINGDDELKTGLHKGDSRLFRTTMKNLPFGNAVLKAESNLEQNFDEIQSR